MQWIVVEYSDESVRNQYWGWLMKNNWTVELFMYHRVSHGDTSKKVYWHSSRNAVIPEQKVLWYQIISFFSICTRIDLVDQII